MSDGYVVGGPAGTISITPGALSAIVQRAAETVDGAAVRKRRRGLDVRIEDRTARVEIGLTAAYGAVLPELARAVQERVAEALARMCGLDVEAVDVTVEELVSA